MTEFDHYAEAKRLLSLAADANDSECAAELLQFAQVHATLAAIPAPRKLSLEQMDAQLSEHVRARFAELREVAAFAAQKSTELEQLREAVRIWLDASAGRALIGDPFAQNVAELIDYRAPEA